MAKGSESTIEVRGCEVHVRRGGSGAPLLYLHGAGGTSAWLPSFDALSEKFDVIAPDHPAFALLDLSHVNEPTLAGGQMGAPHGMHPPKGASVVRGTGDCTQVVEADMVRT